MTQSGLRVAVQDGDRPAAQRSFGAQSRRLPPARVNVRNRRTSLLARTFQAFSCQCTRAHARTRPRPHAHKHLHAMHAGKCFDHRFDHVSQCLNEPRSLNMNPYPDCPCCPADSINVTNVVYSCSFRLVIEWVLLQVFLQTIPVLPL